LSDFSTICGADELTTTSVSSLDSVLTPPEIIGNAVGSDRGLTCLTGICSYIAGLHCVCLLIALWLSQNCAMSGHWEWLVVALLQVSCKVIDLVDHLDNQMGGGCGHAWMHKIAS
jgi:hypothetical protein